MMKNYFTFVKASLISLGVAGFFATISQGQTVVVSADFNASVTQTAGNVSGSNLNAGTTGGSWTINTVGSSLINQETGNAANNALATDLGDYDFDLTFDSAQSFDSNSVTVSLDWVILRTNSKQNAKPNRLFGYDSFGVEVFEIALLTSGAGSGGGAQGRLSYMDGSGTQTVLTSGLTSLGGGPTSFDTADMSSVLVTLDSTGIDISVAGSVISSVNDVSYQNTVSDLAYLSFTGSGNTSSGAWVDNIVVTTIAVPEPSTYALLAGILTCSVVFIRRRRPLI